MPSSFEECGSSLTFETLYGENSLSRSFQAENYLVEVVLAQGHLQHQKPEKTGIAHKEFVLPE